MPNNSVLLLLCCSSVFLIVFFILRRLKLFLVRKKANVENAGALSQKQDSVSSENEIISSYRSPNPRKKFDVFINHRGPDTKQTIAYHIYDLLQARGVAAFLDVKELDPGGVFPEDIVNAVESSKVHICILSPGYAQSAWCLKELVMMLDKCRNGSCLLIPIFFDVEPTDVRFLKGAFRQGFQKLYRHNSKETLDAWKKALFQVSDISGFKGKGEDCKIIVQRICNFVDRTLMSIPSNVVGRQDSLLTIRNAIKRSRNSGFVVTVQITGVGGIGKTTFAELLYNAISSEYDMRCFIEDVNGKVEKGGIIAVQKQLINNLLRYDSSFDFGERQGKQLLKERLHEKDILIVLDNVNQDTRLSDIFVDNDFSPLPTSTIIIISREPVLEYDPRVSKYCENLISFEIPKLDFDESKKIFCNFAFKEIHRIDSRFNDMVNKIVDKCDGVPLALVLFGQHLYGEDITFWKNFWETWEDTMPRDLMKVLKVSYDRLDRLEKRVFLDVAIFFYHEKVDLLRSIREDEHSDSRFSVALRTLEKRLLIKVKDERLHMHDMLRDLGRAIVDDEADDASLGSRSRLWRAYDVKRVLSDEMGTDKVEGLSLVSRGSVVLNEDDEEGKWPVEAISKMTSLEILILHGDCIRGDLSMLPKRLLWLKWTHCPVESIPAGSLYLRRVRVLDLPEGKLRVLWETPTKEAPVDLRQLNLANCINLQKIPEFTERYRHMRRVDFSGCRSLLTIPDSFGFLHGLQCMKMEGCRALVQLPTTMGNLKNLLEFILDNSPNLKLLPKSFGQLPQIRKLRIANCNNLEVTEECFQNIRTLQYVKISCCKVPTLPKQLTQQPCLEYLGVTERQTIWKHPVGWADSLPPTGSISATGQEELSEHFGNLRNLRTFTLESFQLTKLPNSIGSLSCLLELDILGALNLQDLPESIGNLSNLRRLTLSSCLALKELPLSFGNLTNLRVLDLSTCCKLRQLPSSIGKLSHLSMLRIHTCWDLQELPDCIGCLQNLNELEIVGCPNLRGFPYSFADMPNLRRIFVRDCWMVDAIDTRTMVGLKSLTLASCMSLKTIGLSGRSLSSMFGLLNPAAKSLFEMTIDGCLNLQHMPSDANYRKLNFLYLRGCWRLALSDSLLHGLHKLPIIELSLNDGFLSKNNINFKDWTATVATSAVPGLLKLNAKANPLLLPQLKQRLEPAHKGALSSPLAQKLTEDKADDDILVLCFTSSLHIDDFPDHVPLPETVFTCNLLPSDFQFKQFSCGEEIHFGIAYETPAAKELALSIDVTKTSYYPVYEALVNSGWVICLKNGESVSAIADTFYSELKRQRLVSLAWSELPSSVCLFALSALDIANCRITRLHRHCNTCIMEEDMGLILKRRRCLFGDDQALLLSRSNKYRFLAFNLCTYDLKMVANMYEMNICIMKGGKVTHTRKLQDASVNNNEDIPSLLDKVLRSKAQPSNSSTMERWKLENLRGRWDSAQYFP